jgi:cell division protein FtsN
MMVNRIEKKPAVNRSQKVDIVLTRKRFFLWVGGVIAIAAWMFFLGVMVGRGTAPVSFDVEKLRKELISVKEELLQKEKKDAEKEAEKISKKLDLDFYETLTEKKEQARLKNIVPDPVEIKKTQIAPIAKEETVVSEKGSTLTLQVASLKDPKKAEQLIQSLQRKGYDANRHTVQIPGRGMWHRVCVGHFNSSADAQNMLNRLRQEEKFDPIVVKMTENGWKKQRNH